MSNICNICHGEGQYFIKICECPESRVCTECLVGLNIHNHSRCPLCRRNLNIETIINHRERFQILSAYLIRFLIIMFIECIIPIIYFSSDSPNDNQNFVDKEIHWISKDKNIIGLICVAVFIIQPLNIMLYGYMNNISIENCVNLQNNLIKNVCIANLVLETFIFILAKDKVAWYYLILVLFPFYYGICIANMLVIIFSYLVKYFAEIKLRISNTRIVPM